MVKYKIFTLLALSILLYWFVAPAVLTHNVVELVKAGKEDRIPDISYGVWNYYQKGQYVSPNTPKDAVGDLKKMIEEDADLVWSLHQYGMWVMVRHFGKASQN